MNLPPAMRLNAWQPLGWRNKQFSLVIRAALHSIIHRLSRLSDTASLDAQVLLAHVVSKPRAWVLAHPEASLSHEQQDALEIALARLEAGEPLPYVLGRWEFYGLDFSIGHPSSVLKGALENKGPVLIPRPETELLVDRALTWLRAHPGRRAACDVGTGSGCIAVALAAHVYDLHVFATDLSRIALQAARENAQKHGVAHRVQFIQANLLPPADICFDLICANLPYIPTKTLLSLPVARYEPSLALDGGADGLALIGELLQAAPSYLSPGGILLLEIEASQGQSVQSMAEAAFPTACVAASHDLAGHDRLIEVQIPGEKVKPR